ncbi:MAG: DUF2892 domain-containing protein [Bacteroidetes bacterium]|nr:DUF2892 domain-containing protein [Bacteroidota bacterium]
MKQNMGASDRFVRILLAIIVAALYLTHQVSGTIAIVLLILAGVFVLTSIFSFCPLYLPFGLSTGKKQQESETAK